MAAIVGGASSLVTDPNGALKDQLQTTVTDLGTQATADFAASLTGLDTIFNQIVSDWGKLSAVDDGLRNHPGEWSVFGDKGRIVAAMTNAMTIGYYRALKGLRRERDR
jgi:hypothetical protein